MNNDVDNGGPFGLSWDEFIGVVAEAYRTATNQPTSDELEMNVNEQLQPGIKKNPKK